MADRLTVTDLDFDTIKTNLRNFLRQQSEFQDYDFEGSGLNILLDILAYNTHYNAYYLNMVANESFLDSAILRNSVVSHAKKLGYVPRSATAPIALVRVVVETGNSTPGTLSLPRGYVFLSSQIDGVSYRFVTLDAYSATKVGTTYTFNNVKIYEGQFSAYSYVNSYTSNPKQIFTIPSDKVDTSTLRVSVRQSTSNTQTEVYERAEDVLNITSNSQIYFLQEGRNGQYEVYFGDDVLGKKIPDGGVVNFEYLITSASEANQANNFISTASIGGFTSIAVNPIKAASGGTVRETVEQIKFAAPLSLLSQNRAVTKNDYIRLIQQKYPTFEAVNVWGGEENDPPVFGKVFVSAKPKQGFEITQTEKEFVRENILKPISILTVTPEIIDIDYNYLKIASTVFYDATKTTQSNEDFKNSIRTTILNYCNNNLNKFNSYFKYSGLETAIDAYSSSIVSNEVELFVAKKFRPVLGQSDSYVLDYGFELARGTTNDNFYSSPDFTVVDEEGVPRQCFFEEIPSSFTGLESVTVTNPGYGYTSTPAVNIVGDGEGATAFATIVNGKLSKIEVTSPGVGYTTAAIQIVGGGGYLGAATAVLEGRYGQIRISYFKTDAISSQSTKVVINRNRNNGITGTIDYVLGKIYINDFYPTAVNNSFGDIMVHIKPKINIIQSKLNHMLVLDPEDASSITVNTVTI
jgi:hypothetical protein